MLTDAELLIAHGLKSKDFAEVESGNSPSTSGEARLEVAIQKMAESKKKKKKTARKGYFCRRLHF